jgi:hypothetical protein
MSTKTKKQIAKLATMKVNELQAKFAEVTGETSRSPNRTFLIRRVTEALMAAEAGVKASKAKRPRQALRRRIPSPRRRGSRSSTCPSCR